MHFIQTLQQIWSGFPLFIKIVSIVAITSFLAALSSMLYLYIIKLIANARNLVKKRLRVRLRTLLLEKVIMPSGESEHITIDAATLEPFQTILSTKEFAHGVLVDEIIHFREVFSGNVAKQLRKLYLDLDLHFRAVKKLSGRNWIVVSRNLVQLFKMEVHLPRKVIMGLTKHKNRYVKEVARWYVIKLSYESPLHFLERLDEPIVPWEELEIIKLFTEKESFILPPIGYLLETSNEPTVISLGLKLGGHFKQYEAIPFIIRLLEHKNIKVRKDAVQTLGILKATTAEQYLINMYETQPDDIKITILNTLGQLGTGLQLPFIEEQLQSEEFEIVRSASIALVRQIKYSKVVVEKLLNSSAGQVRKLIKYFLNPSTN